jgi:hypothetical protein
MRDEDDDRPCIDCAVGRCRACLEADIEHEFGERECCCGSQGEMPLWT